MLSNQIPEAKKLKHFGSLTHSYDGEIDMEASRRVRSGWNNWKMSGVLCDRRIPPNVQNSQNSKTTSHALHDRSLSLTTQQNSRLKVVEKKTCRWVNEFTRKYVRIEE